MQPTHDRLGSRRLSLPKFWLGAAFCCFVLYLVGDFCIIHLRPARPLTLKEMVAFAPLLFCAAFSIKCGRAVGLLSRIGFGILQAVTLEILFSHYWFLNDDLWPCADYAAYSLWTGMAVGFALVFAITTHLGALAWDRYETRKLRWKARCENCGYSLIGLTEPRCPECGTAFDAFRLRRLAEAARDSGKSNPPR